METTNGVAKKPRKPKSDAILAAVAAMPIAEVTPTVAPTATERKIAVKVPQIKVARMTVTIRGISPYLAHGWSAKSIKMMEDKQQGAAMGKKEKRDPKAEFEAAKILDDKGIDSVPALHIKCAMASASTFVDGMSRKEILGSIFVEGQYLPLNFKKCVMRTDIARVGGGMNKVASPVYRPEYHDWSVNVPIRFIENHVSAAEVVNLLNLAGMCIGLGDWRIEKKGTHGAFEVVL